MNEPRFKFYLLYMIDLHNIHIEGRVQVKANPLNIDRDMILTEKNTKIISKDFDELEIEFDTRLGSVQVLYKHVFPNSGPPTPRNAYIA